jgi:glycosyltransferase involved in cell wall biosynthesis
MRINTDNTTTRFKIAVVPDNIGKMGGTRSFLYKVCSIYNKHNLSATLVIQSDHYDDAMATFCMRNSISVILLRTRSQLFHKPYFSIVYDVYVYLLIRIKMNPNQITASVGTPGLFAGFFLFNTSLIYFVHTIPNKLGWKARGMNLTTKFFSGPKKFVVTVSEYSKNKIHKYMLVDRNCIHVIYNSIQKVPNSIRVFKNVDIVLTIGHVVRYKNIEIWYLTAKKVIKENPHVLFYWVGEGEGLSEMEKRVVKDGVSKNIFFTGYSDNVTQYYDLATIYFQPSLIESHGISLIDAMSYALPCVASNVGGMPESIENDVSGYLLEPYDTEGFTKKICDLLEDKKLASKMGKKGEIIARSKFSAQIQEDAILSLSGIVDNRQRRD